MNRAERRKEAKNASKVVANLSLPKSEINRIKKEATEEALSTAFVLLMSLPIKVACEKYGWSDEDLEGFANDICDEYKAFQDGELTLEQLQDYVFEHCGIKFGYR